MFIFSDALTGGMLGGTIAAVIIALICLVVIVAGFFMRYDGFPAIVGGAICLLITAGIWLWASWPLAYDYHHWVDKKVTVTEVAKRQVSSDSGFYEKFVVKDDTGAYYGIDDTRAALVKPGETLKLRCKKAYQFGIDRSSHGWDCRWAA